eukprot:scaffold16457_cov117-Skeletonema_marinoi.AAC.2
MTSQREGATKTMLLSTKSDDKPTHIEAAETQQARKQLQHIIYSITGNETMIGLNEHVENSAFGFRERERTQTGYVSRTSANKEISLDSGGHSDWRLDIHLLRLTLPSYRRGRNDNELIGADTCWISLLERIGASCDVRSEFNPRHLFCEYRSTLGRTRTPNYVAPMYVGGGRYWGHVRRNPFGRTDGMTDSCPLIYMMMMISVQWVSQRN